MTGQSNSRGLTSPYLSGVTLDHFDASERDWDHAADFFPYPAFATNTTALTS